MHSAVAFVCHQSQSLLEGVKDSSDQPHLQWRTVNSHELCSLKY